ncbi:MAG: hypothetical protein E7265_03560 [Lachnospiraceae bacterium]|nr:hypothetical protein [Lachnospiraceae bacterium]
MEQHNEEVQIDLMEILFVIKRRLVFILFVAIIFAVAAGVGTKYLINPKYSSTSSVYVLTKESVLSYADLQIGATLTSDYIELITSPTVLETVIKNLKKENELSVKQFKSLITVSNPSDTRILNITVTYGDPGIAKILADELTEVSCNRIEEVMKMDRPNIFEKGKVDTVPVSPSLVKNVAIAGILGFMFASGVIIVAHLMDDTIHSAEDIEKYLNLNTLAAIPISEGSEADIRRDNRKRRKGDSFFTIMKRRFKKNKKSAK